MFYKRGMPLAGALMFLLTAASAEAQLVNDINGLKVNPKVVFSDPHADSQIQIDVSGFPTSATILETGFTNNGNPTQFNRHDLMFSANGGTSARKFQNQEAFDISFDVTLNAMYDSPRKEAGMRVNFFGFDGQFIITLNDDVLKDGEIAAFGGTLPFYSFTDPVIPEEGGTPGGGQPLYTMGETINMRMVYTPPVLDGAMPPAVVEPGTIQYHIDRGAGYISSPVLEFTGIEGGLINNSEVGVYSQATGRFGTTDDFVNVSYANFDFDGPDAVDDADFDGDDDVDGNDFLIWQRGVGTPNATLADGDANQDEVVDGLDLGVWKTQFGVAATSAVNLVPEPASLGLIVVGAAALAAGSRRRTKP